MKKTLLALSLVIIMLFSFSFTGCNKAAVEKTAEEHLTAAFDDLFASEDNAVSEFAEKLNVGGKATLSVGNIEPFLMLAGVDATAIPPISDIALDMYVGNDGKYAVESLSAMIGDTLCDITAYVDLDEILLSSAQGANVYSFSFDELMELAGAELPYTIEDLTKYDDAFFEAIVTKYAEKLETLFFENATLTKTDDGDNVVIKADVTADGFAVIVDSMADAISADAELLEFVTTMYGEEVAAEFTALGESTDTVAEDLTAAGFVATADFVLAKETSVMSVAKIKVVADDSAVDVVIENNDDNFKVTATGGGQTFAVCVSATGFTVVGTEEGVEEELVNIAFNAADGKATLSCSAEGSPTVTVTGSYEATDTTFTYVMEEVELGDAKIDLTEAEIAFNVDTEGKAPEKPAATASLLELTEEDFQNLAMEFVINSGLLAYIAQ